MFQMYDSNPTYRSNAFRTNQSHFTSHVFGWFGSLCQNSEDPVSIVPVLLGEFGDFLNVPKAVESTAEVGLALLDICGRFAFQQQQQQK